MNASKMIQISIIIVSIMALSNYDKVIFWELAALIIIIIIIITAVIQQILD